MNHLAANCSTDLIIELLQNKYSFLSMGGNMKNAFINKLSNLSHSININYIAKQLVEIYFQQ
jgi:hypothetical protein